MNKHRREKLNKLHSQLEDIKVEVENLKDDEQEAFDNMPESLQQGDIGQICESAVSSLEEAVSSIENAMFEIDSATAN